MPVADPACVLCLLGLRTDHLLVREALLCSARPEVEVALGAVATFETAGATWTLSGRDDVVSALSVRVRDPSSPSIGLLGEVLGIGPSWSSTRKALRRFEIREASTGEYASTLVVRRDDLHVDVELHWFATGELQILADSGGQAVAASMCKDCTACAGDPYSRTPWARFDLTSPTTLYPLLTTAIPPEAWDMLATRGLRSSPQDGSWGGDDLRIERGPAGVVGSIELAPAAARALGVDAGTRRSDLAARYGANADDDRLRYIVVADVARDPVDDEPNHFVDVVFTFAPDGALARVLLRAHVEGSLVVGDPADLTTLLVPARCLQGDCRDGDGVLRTADGYLLNGAFEAGALVRGRVDHVGGGYVRDVP